MSVAWFLISFSTSLDDLLLFEICIFFAYFMLSQRFCLCFFFLYVCVTKMWKTRNMSGDTSFFIPLYLVFNSHIFYFEAFTLRAQVKMWRVSENTKHKYNFFISLFSFLSKNRILNFFSKLVSTEKIKSPNTHRPPWWKVLLAAHIWYQLF